MQTDVGGPLAQGTPSDRQLVPVYYAYVARYAYSDVVVQNDNFLRLSPYDDWYQSPIGGGCDVATIPVGRRITYTDRLGNQVNRVRITAPHQELIIAAAGHVGLNEQAPQVSDMPLHALEYGPEAREFLTASQLADPATVKDTAQELIGHPATLLDTVAAVIGWVYRNIRYERGNTSVNTVAADVLQTRSGVCQDMTHLALAILRARGVPARYVSGLLTHQPGETHAWLEFLHPHHGWLPADPTRGLVELNGADYLKFAVGRDYSEVPPVSGSFVSRGAGWLNFTTAEVFFDRDAVSLDDALALLDNS